MDLNFALKPNSTPWTPAFVIPTINEDFVAAPLISALGKPPSHRHPYGPLAYMAAVLPLTSLGTMAQMIRPASRGERDTLATLTSFDCSMLNVWNGGNSALKGHLRRYTHVDVVIKRVDACMKSHFEETVERSQTCGRFASTRIGALVKAKSSVSSSPGRV